METPTLNLLPRQEVSLGEKAVNWALTSGRVIVVVTEFMVISALLYRFVLDQTLTNLHDRIDENSTIVEESKETEMSVRLVQKQLADVEKVSLQQQPFYLIINLLAQSRPPEVTFTEVGYKGNQVSVSASTNRPAAVGEFFQNLRQNPAFSKVIIEEMVVSTGKVRFVINTQINWPVINNEKV